MAEAGHARSAARDEVVDRGLLDDGGPLAVVLIRHGAEGAGPADAERLFRDQPGARALAACCTTG